MKNYIQWSQVPILAWDLNIINLCPNSFLWFDPLRTLESCMPLAGCACVIGFGLLSTARDRVKAFHLTYPAHGSLSGCPCLCAGALTAMTLMTWSVIIIFPWSPKCTWNKAMINLCYRTYSRINGHAVIELYVKWRTNTTKRHNSWSVLCTKPYCIRQWIFSLHPEIQ